MPKTNAPKSAYSFFHPIRVRWAELDPQGIVFNPNYFMYFDVGGTEYMRAIGAAYPGGLAEHGADFFAVHAEADFKSSARYDDQLDLGVRVAHIGRTSLRFEFGLFRADELLVEGHLVYAAAGIESRASMPVPASFVEKIVAFERTPPTRAPSA